MTAPFPVGQTARRRVQYSNSYFDGRWVIAPVAANSLLASVKIDNTPPGWYGIQVHMNGSGLVVATDYNNVVLLHNNERVVAVPLSTLAWASGFPIVRYLNQNDTLEVRTIAAGSAAGHYQAGLLVGLIHEAAAHPEESPDTMAILARQQERIHETLERLCHVLAKQCEERKGGRDG